MTFSPDYRVVPGATLRDWMDEHDVSQEQVAKRWECSQQYVSKVVRGKAHVGVGLALKLEKLTGAPAEFWLTRQMHYDLHEARERASGSLRP